MIWKSECRRVRRLIALDVGQDLAGPEGEGVRQHVSGCAHCQTHWERVRAGHQALEEVRTRTAGENASHPSLWPDLRERLLARQQVLLPRPRVRQPVNGWLPIGALAAACIAVLVVTDSRPPADRVQFSDLSPHVVQPVGNSISWPGEPAPGVQDAGMQGERGVPGRARSLRPGAGRSGDGDLDAGGKIPEDDDLLQSPLELVSPDLGRYFISLD